LMCCQLHDQCSRKLDNLTADHIRTTQQLHDALATLLVSSCTSLN